jgi:hypoxanthine phosphoribosyltransferase
MGKADLNVGWDEYHRLVERLALQIHESGWAFDAIVCLARGGLRVGDTLSRIFDRPLGVMFTSSYREKGGREQGEILVGEHLCSAAALPGPRWLLVDDLVDSGHTLVEILRILPARHPQLRELRSAVIWQKAVSVIRPDYVVEYLADSPWIRQPFEVYDTLRPEALRDRVS